MLINRYKGVKENASALAKVVKFDLNSYKALLDALKKDVTLSQVAVSMIYNLASGHFIVGKYPSKKVNKRGEYTLLRTPKDSIDRYYLNVMPVYIKDFARIIALMDDACAVSDILTLRGLIMEAQGIIKDAISPIPNKVESYVQSQTNFSEYFRTKKDKPLYVGQAKNRIYIRKCIPDHEVIEHIKDVVIHDDGTSLL